MFNTFDDDYMPPARPWWARLYRDFMHWLWHGPLTCDLYPYRPLEQWRRPDE